MIFKQKNNKVFYDGNFYMKFFATLNSKNIIATLRIVTIEKPESIFLLVLYINDSFDYCPFFSILKCHWPYLGFILD